MLSKEVARVKIEDIEVEGKPEPGELRLNLMGVEIIIDGKSSKHVISKLETPEK